MIETDLFDFAYVPDWYGQLDELSKLALPEPWRFKKPIYKTKNEDILYLMRAVKLSTLESRLALEVPPVPSWYR